MASLGVSVEEFYDFSPVEFYYAMKAKGDNIKFERQHRYEVARYIAVSIVNFSGNIEKQIENVRDFTTFPWEEGKERVVVEESTDQIVSKVYAIAHSFGFTKRVKEDMDGPPLHLAPKHKK